MNDDLNWFIKKKLDSFYNLKELGKYPTEADERRALAQAIREAVKHDRQVRSE